MLGTRRGPSNNIGGRWVVPGAPSVLGVLAKCDVPNCGCVALAHIAL